jgi:hypothetical protein
MNDYQPGCNGELPVAPCAGGTMKIQMTLEVSDPARKYIASLADCETIDSGLATREAVMAYVQSLVARLNEDGSILPTGKLTEEEAKDAADAITYLRKQGKTEGQIRAWLLLQKARFNFGVQG